MSSPDEVYIGVWNNWTEEPSLSSTLTVTKQNGALLEASLVLFLSFTGSCLWKLCTYVVFELPIRNPHTSHQDPSTARTHASEYLLFARLQAILRNSNTALSGLVDFIDAARQALNISRRKKLLMCVPLIIFAILLYAWIGVASIVPSRFISTGPDVLLRPRSCGVWPEFPENVTNYGDAVSEAIKYTGAWTGQTVQNMAKSSHLTQYCYDATGTTAAMHCNSPGRRFVDWTFNTTDTCPFGNVSCLSTRSLILDSGLVDSHVDLGINTRMENRIAFRKTLTCAVPDLKDYTTVFNRNNVTAVMSTPYYHMSKPGITVGAVGNATSAYLDSVSSSTTWQAISLGRSYLDNTDATFLWNSQRSTATWSGLVSGNGPAYTIQTAYYTPSKNNGDSQTQASALANANTLSKTFDPIPAFRRDNASTVLIFLTNDMIYSGEVDDPWFGPTSPVNGTVFGDNMTAYLADRAVSAIACFESAELCNIGLSSRPCAPVNMYGASLQGNLADELGLNRQQISIATRLSAALQRSSFSTAVRELNGGSLRATAKSFAWGSNPVAEDQWILEMQSWFATILVTTQTAIRQFVTGYENAQYNTLVTPAVGDDAWMCHAQITQSSDYTSYHVLYIVLILFIGGFIIAGSYTLPSAVNWLRGRQETVTQWDSMALPCLVEQRCSKESRESWVQVAAAVSDVKGSALSSTQGARTQTWT